MAFSLIVCGPRMSRSHGSRHVFPQEDFGRPRLSSDRRKPSRGRIGAPAGHRHARPRRGFAGKRVIGAPAAIGGVEGLDLHHLYRAMAWLGEELAEDQQDGATSFAPRCLKDVVEEELFARRRDLFSTLDLVFMDTTSLYFEGAGGQTLGRRGFSKDHRPDLNQMILAVLLDGDGRP